MSLVRPVGVGEVVKDVLIIRGPVFYEEPGSDPPMFHRLELQDQGGGLFSFVDTGQSTEVPFDV